MFAGLYYYSTLLAPLTGEEIFGWRMLLTLPCVTLFMIISKEWKHVVLLLARLRRAPMLILGLCISSALLGIQQWLFMWAPLNGRGLQVSLGYFLLPLAMLLAGRLLYRERLTFLQKVAGLSAALGVTYELYQVGGFSWEALLVAIGFPIYFILRRKLGTDHLGGLWFDMLLTLPFAAWIVMGQHTTTNHFAQNPRLYILVVLLAVISAIAFMSYIVARPTPSAQSLRIDGLRRTCVDGRGCTDPRRANPSRRMADLHPHLDRCWHADPGRCASSSERKCADSDH
jgi:chloramphenicol-sensitive protein RarD